MRFILQNHQEKACLRDTLRLFFSRLEICEGGFLGPLYAVSPAYQGLDLVITSTLSRPLSLAVLRGREEAPPVVVTTRLIHQAALGEPGPREGQIESLWQVSQTVPSADVRRELKRQAYFALSELSGISWPWGSLTGVRPSQVANQLLEKGIEPSLLAQTLQEHFALDPLKATKLVQVTLTEQAILATLPSEDYLVYLGVPFCPGRCAYCSFIAQDASRFADQLGDYARALAREIQLVGQELAGRGQVAALYMGGGTPTSLSAADLDLVLSSARRYLPLRPDAELTVEAGRADTLDRGKLQVMQDQGIGRLCINPQTMQDRTLKRIGRRHTVAQVYNALDLARQTGFDDINMDLILGLPGEDPQDFADSLSQVLGLAPASLTIHSLAFKRSAYLFDQFQNLSQGDQVEHDPAHSSAQDLQAQLLLPDPVWLAALNQAEANLQMAGYGAYYLYRQKQVISGLENTGYTQAGQACAYNVGMMSDQRQVIGLGAGAASKRLKDGRLDRLYNTKDLGEYMANIESIAHKKAQFFLG